MLWKIPVFCFIPYMAVNVIAATYLFFKEKSEVKLIMDAIENADKED